MSLELIDQSALNNEDPSIQPVLVWRCSTCRNSVRATTLALAERHRCPPPPIQYAPPPAPPVVEAPKPKRGRPKKVKQPVLDGAPD
jgi:hypothetical protein